jgi:Family of unknown function (DUF6072)
MSQQSSTLNNAVKLVGEYFLPGASRLLDGEVKDGVVHLAAGVVARMFLGPFGLLLVKANSYSRSVTGKNVTEVVGLTPSEPQPVAEAAESRAEAAS